MPSESLVAWVDLIGKIVTMVAAIAALFTGAEVLHLKARQLRKQL